MIGARRTARPRSRRTVRRRTGITLLELVVAAALMGGVTASMHVVLRGAREATDQLRGENDVLRHADAGLRFVTRQCRGAKGVAQINAANSSIHLDVGGGETVRLFLSAAGDLRMDDSRIVPQQVRSVADHITAFIPTLYEADGVTATTDPTLAGLIDISLTVDLPRDHSPSRTVSGRVWVRRW
jgi:hypothetical protein